MDGDGRGGPRGGRPDDGIGRSCRCRQDDGDRLPYGRRIELPAAAPPSSARSPGRPARRPSCCLHGWVASGGLNWFQAFEPLARALQHRRPRPARPRAAALRTRHVFRLADCADDCAATLVELGTGPVIAVGYSMGGPVAQLMWRRHRDLVDGLVLCATSAGFVPEPPSRARRTRRAMLGVARHGAPCALTGALAAAGADGADLHRRDDAGVGRGRDAPPRLAHDRRGRSLDQHVQRAPLDRRGRRPDRGRVHDRGPRRHAVATARRPPTRSPAPPCTPSPTGTSPAPTRASPSPLARRLPRRRRRVADPLTATGLVSRGPRRRPRPTSAAVRAAPTIPAPSRAPSTAASRSRANANMMCPAITMSSARNVESCTNVAPVRQLSGNGSNQRMIEPVISITTIDGADEHRVQLLTGIELAELHVDRGCARDHQRRSSAVQRLKRDDVAAELAARRATARRAGSGSAAASPRRRGSSSPRAGSRRSSTARRSSTTRR